MFAVLAVFILLTTVYSLPIDCQLNGYQLTCQHSLPVTLPNTTKEVYILAQYGRTDGVWYDEQTFRDRSWQSVTKLDVTVLDRNGWVNLENNIFQNLENLKYLGYHDPALNKISKWTFNGLKHLTTLNLAGCINLNGERITQALTDIDTLPQIDTLLLDAVQSKYESMLKLEEPFWNIIHTKKINTLSLSKISSVIKWEHVKGKLSSLRSINISHSVIVWDFGNNMVSLLSPELQNLTTIDISYIFVGHQPLNHLRIPYIKVNCNKIEWQLFPLLNQSEVLYMDGIAQQATIIDIAKLDLSSCHLPIKVLHAAKNHVQKLNVTVKFPQNMSLYELDLSYNELSYISPGVFSRELPLKKLDLGYNFLSEMERYPEFSRLFADVPLLENLSLASNRLKTIPTDMFVNNKHMKELDLSNNSLDHISFETKYLSELVELDLSGNNISIIDDTSVARLEQLLQNKSDIFFPVRINMENNPYICSCDSIKSVKWLIVFQKVTKQELYCKMSEKYVMIREETGSSLLIDCSQKLRIIQSTTYTVIALLFLTAVVVIARHRIKKEQAKNAVQKFITNYRNGNSAEKFVVMLSYSSEESREIIAYIYETLETQFKKMLGVNRDTVCVDFKHFKLGRPIMNEMISAIQNSAVVVFAVSKSFCQHEWCIREFEEALHQNKPMILIHLETIDVNIMPHPLRTVHNRFTRANLKHLGDGQYQLTPSPCVLANSVIELASVKMITKRKTVLC